MHDKKKDLRQVDEAMRRVKRIKVLAGFNLLRGCFWTICVSVEAMERWVLKLSKVFFLSFLRKSNKTSSLKWNELDSNFWKHDFLRNNILFPSSCPPKPQISLLFFFRKKTSSLPHRKSPSATLSQKLSSFNQIQWLTISFVDALSANGIQHYSTKVFKLLSPGWIIIISFNIIIITCHFYIMTPCFHSERALLSHYDRGFNPV